MAWNNLKIHRVCSFVKVTSVVATKQSLDYELENYWVPSSNASMGISKRHKGHLRLLLSHFTIQSPWKIWEQGNRIASEPNKNSSIQMLHLSADESRLSNLTFSRASIDGDRFPPSSGKVTLPKILRAILNLFLLAIWAATSRIRFTSSSLFSKKGISSLQRSLSNGKGMFISEIMSAMLSVDKESQWNWKIFRVMGPKELTIFELDEP